MSLLRMLSPVRAQAHSGAGAGAGPGPSTMGAARREKKILLELHLPTYGAVFMKPPDDPLWPHARSAGPRDDQLLTGVLDVQVPKGSGQRRCKSVRVGVRTKARLFMGPGRGWEEDVIFERKVELLSGNAEGMLLDEGVQRFEFTLILPSTFAPHDWHQNSKVYQELFAELEGQPEPSSPFSIFGLSGRRGTSASRASLSSSSKRGSFTSGSSSPRSRAHSPSRSPSLTSSPLTLSPMLSPNVMSITRQEEIELPSVPSYAQSQADSLGTGLIVGGKADDWIVGVHETARSIMVLHNPNSAGGSTDLDVRQNGFAPGIGIWDLKIFSDVFSIGGPIHARLTLPSLDPKATIFSWRLSLKQTHQIRSPRDHPDTKPITESRVFGIIEHGRTPPRGAKNPGVEHPAFWRGSEAGGTSTGKCKIEGNAFMPKDDRGRPTTLPGIETPIQVSHVFLYEVYFSVWGEDDQGKPMATPGPGGLRFLQVVKPIILPSCALIPSVLDLPQYAPCQLDLPCPTCGLASDAQICLVCPPTSVPHPRHDHPLHLSKDKDGSCPACCQRFLPALLPQGQEQCACGLGVEDIEGRMGQFVTEGMRCEDREAIMRQKEVDERGRGRTRERSRSESRSRQQVGPRCRTGLDEA